MLNLLVKDFKLLFHSEKKLSTRILSTILTIFFGGCFVAIEIFIFSTILTKLGSFHLAQDAFTSLFISIVSIILIVFNLFNANKLFSNEKDIEQLSCHPVSNSEIILSKLFFMFIIHCFTSLVFIYPIFISYGIIQGRSIRFYYLGLFYPLLSFLFIGGMALILVYPFWLFKKFLNQKLLIKFLFTIAVFLGFSILYAKVLNLFIEIVAGGNINRLLTTETIELIVDMKKYQVPINFLTEVFMEGHQRYLFIYLMIAGGVFILGLTIVIFAFNYVRNISLSSHHKMQKYSYKVLSYKKALIKKECILLTKNASYSTTFTSLIIVQPLLLYLVLKALTTIFRSGVFAYYILLLPSFIEALSILLIMMFSLIISQGASNYIEMEGKSIKVSKTIPVSPLTQLLIKVGIPFILSVISLVISSIILVVTKCINIKTFIFGLILTIIVLMIFNVISLKEELSVRHHKARSTFRSSLCSYLLPFIVFVGIIFLSYISVNIILTYIILSVLLVVILIPITLRLRKNIDNMFLELDMVN